MNCPFCGEPKNRYIGDVTESALFAGIHVAVPGRPSLFECPNCALLFKDPLGDEKALESLYKLGASSTWGGSVTSRKDWAFADSWLSQKYRGGEILDVGCWDGRFLGSLSHHWKKFGIEIHREAATSAAAKGIKIIGDTFSALCSLLSAFDVITVFDVFEHVVRPREFFSSLIRNLKAGGIIIMASGNSDSWPAGFARNRYWYCSSAEHRIFVNPAWCYRAAAQYGLKIVIADRFSHSGSHAITQTIIEAAKNLIYAASPGLYFWGRRSFAALKGRSRSQITASPPSWISRKDHFIVIFAKAQ